MVDNVLETVELRLTTNDRALFRKYRDVARAHLKSLEQDAELDRHRDIQLKTLDVVEARGSFDPYYVLGFGVAIATVGAPLAVWCLAHARKNGAAIPMASAEAEALVAAVTAVPQNEGPTGGA